MTHADWIDPELAAKRCTAAENEVVLLRNGTPPMAWSDIAAIVRKTRGEVRRLWSSANRKVNGGHVPQSDADKAHKRATEQNDPDSQLVGQGVPLVGTRGAIPGTVPGGHPRPWEIRHNRLDREGK